MHVGLAPQARVLPKYPVEVERPHILRNIFLDTTDALAIRTVKQTDVNDVRGGREIENIFCVLLPQTASSPCIFFCPAYLVYRLFPCLLLPLSWQTDMTDPTSSYVPFLFLSSRVSGFYPHVIYVVHITDCTISVALLLCHRNFSRSSTGHFTNFSERS